MKSLFFLTLSSLLFSCNQKVANEGKKLPDIFDNVYVTDNTEIIGNWTMCSASGHGMMTQYNVCPTVSFLNNGTGYFGNSSILAERFTWTLKKRALNIFYKDTGSKGDTSLWYKWQSAKYRKTGLRDMLFTPDSIRFRFSTEVEAVEIWTNDFIHFEGAYSIFTTSTEENSNGNQEKEPFFSGYWVLTPNDARKAYDLYKSLGIASIKPQDSIQGWQSGLDGDEFIIEHSTPTSYSFKPYWTPSSFKDKISDAFLIDSFSNSIQKAIRFSERFSKFISTLPKGCYRVGSYFATCNYLRAKRKRKSGG